ncbi:MAG: hypothetical protein LBS59_02515 [Puniceicoccales bacterium]|nr:hypothetical protein [Puniceicoccales bacterium]
MQNDAIRYTLSSEPIRISNDSRSRYSDLPPKTDADARSLRHWRLPRLRILRGEKNSSSHK